MTEIQAYPLISQTSNKPMYRTMYVELGPKLAEIIERKIPLMALGGEIHP